jgi:hypothetical protein
MLSSMHACCMLALCTYCDLNSNVDSGKNEAYIFFGMPQEESSTSNWLTRAAGSVTMVHRGRHLHATCPPAYLLIIGMLGFMEPATTSALSTGPLKGELECPEMVIVDHA